jgi:tetratricopeptide (TPR) repeat protein
MHEENLAAAMRRFADAEAGGRLADRDAAILHAVETLRRVPRDIPGRAGLAVAAGRALRHRFRGSFALADLDAAVGVLTAAESETAGRPEWPAVAAELARAYVALWTAIEIGMVVAPGPSGVPLAAANVAAQAEEFARRAVAAAPEGSPLAADTAHALGAALWAKSDLDGAIEWLSRSEDADARWLHARSLAARYDERGEAADLDAASALLGAAARDQGAPREAFEAARFHGFWAAARREWDEAAGAWLLGLRLREALRRAQREDLHERNWLIEAGGLPSSTANALVRAGRLEEAVESLDAALFTEIADRLGSAEEVGVLDFAGVARVADAEPLVYLVVGTPTGHALVVADRAVSAAELPKLTSEALHERLFAYVTQYGNWQKTLSPEGLARWVDELERMSEWLWSAVMEPVLVALPAGTGAVTVVTDGVLGLLPLHAAGDMLDRLRIRMAPNAAALARAAATADARDGLIVAAPDVPNEAPLPFAAAEAYAVATLMPRAEVLVGAAAGAPAVESKLAATRVAHIACHGKTRFDDPGESRLILGDGQPLTLRRLLELRLTGTRLAVLSACESGMPEVVVPQEKTSLAAGLMLAGVAGVVASLWAVGDQSTMLLMTRLHELCAHGTDACTALQESQRWLRDASPDTLSKWTTERAEAMAQAGAPEPQVAQMKAAGEELGDAVRPFEGRFHWAGFNYVGA